MVAITATCILGPQDYPHITDDNDDDNDGDEDEESVGISPSKLSSREREQPSLESAFPSPVDHHHISFDITIPADDHCHDGERKTEDDISDDEKNVTGILIQNWQQLMYWTFSGTIRRVG